MFVSVSLVFLLASFLESRDTATVQQVSCRSAQNRAAQYTFLDYEYIPIFDDDFRKYFHMWLTQSELMF